MADHPPTRRSLPTSDMTGGADSPLMTRAGEIFFSVRALGLAEQDDAIRRLCAGDASLEQLVRLLVTGDDAPLPVEALAEEVREAHNALETRSPASAEFAPTGPRPESHIGNYKLLERIGEGGFGVVYMAEQSRPVKRRVALKVIKLGMDTRQVVARFEAERQALAMMDHPNIARVFDGGATPAGRPYFVMELVRGMPITEYCDARKLDVRARLDLFSQVCDAIQHAHQKGVIHRDIKPSNVLVTEIGESVVPKVIDFGIAKATSAHLTDKTVFTEMRQMIGTPEYMSPEQASVSSLDVDTRTDVYSLGVLLYELLAGSTPFDSARLRSAAFGELQRIIREEDPPRPSARLTKLATKATIAAVRGGIEPARLGSVLRGELDWVVMKCLEKDRIRRYDSAGSLLREIRRFLSGEAVQAVPPSVAYRVSKFVRKNKGPVLAGSLLAIALLGGLAGTTYGYLSSETLRRAAVDEKGRADRKADEALTAESQAQRLAYSTSMLMACGALANNSYAVAKTAIDSAPERLRGWEWRVLHARLDTSTKSLKCPMPGWAPGGSGWATQLVAHPDGRSFFALRGLETEAVERLDLATGARLAMFPRPGSSPPSLYSPTRLVLSPDGSRLALYTGLAKDSPDFSVSEWDLHANERTSHSDLPRNPEITGTLALDPQGKLALRADYGTRTVFLQDVRTGSVLERAQWADFWPVHAWAARDGSMFACSDAVGVVRVFDSHTLAIRATLQGHQNITHGMDFSLDGRFLATGSLDGTARVWDLAAQPPSCVVIDHKCGVENVLFSSDGVLLATAGTDLALRVWNPRTAQLQGIYSGEGLIRGALMFLPDNRTIAGRESDGTVRFWDTTADATVNLRGHQGYINRASLARESGVIISAAWDGWKGQPGCVRLWDEETGEAIASFGAPGEVAYKLAVSPDGAMAAVSITAVECPWTPRDRIGHNRVEVINLRTAGLRVIDCGEEGQSFGDTSGLAFDPGSTMIAVARKRSLDIVSAADGSLLRRRELSGKTLVRPIWSPDGRTIVCAISSDPERDAGGQPTVLDAVTLESLRELNQPFTVALAFTPTGDRIAAGSSLGSVRLFDAATGKLLHELRAHSQLVNDLAFSPDGTRLATVGGDEGDITIWDTATWDRVAQFHEDGFVGSAEWNRTGTRLMGACYKTIRLWEAVPLRERVSARERRAAAIARVQPVVNRLCEQLSSPEEVAARMNDDRSLSQDDRRAALQLLLRKRFDQSRGSGL